MSSYYRLKCFNFLKIMLFRPDLTNLYFNFLSEGEEEADKEKKKGRSLVSKKTLETLENAAVDALLKAKEKYL